MLEQYLSSVASEEKKKTARNALAEALEDLPLEELSALANGTAKLASCTPTLPGGETSNWLGQFKGTPLFDEAFQMEQAALELDMAAAQRRVSEGDTWAKQDLLRVQRRKLELALVAAGEGGAPAEAPQEEALPALEAPEVEEPEEEDEDEEETPEAPAPEAKTAGSVTQLPTGLARSAAKGKGLARSLAEKARVFGGAAAGPAAGGALVGAGIGASAANAIDDARGRAQVNKTKKAGVVVPFGGKATGAAGKALSSGLAKLRGAGAATGAVAGLAGGAALGVAGARAVDKGVDSAFSKKEKKASARSELTERLSDGEARGRASGGQLGLGAGGAMGGLGALELLRPRTLGGSVAAALGGGILGGVAGGMGGSALGAHVGRNRVSADYENVRQPGGPSWRDLDNYEAASDELDAANKNRATGFLTGGGLGAVGGALLGQKLLRSPGLGAVAGGLGGGALGAHLGGKGDDAARVEKADQRFQKALGKVYPEELEGKEAAVSKRAFAAALAGMAAKALPGAGAAIAKGGLQAGKLVNQIPGMAAKGMGSGVARGAQSLGQAVTHGGVAGGAKNLARGAVGFAKANPLAAAGIAGGAGLLAGKALD